MTKRSCNRTLAAFLTLGGCMSAWPGSARAQSDSCNALLNVDIRNRFSTSDTGRDVSQATRDYCRAYSESNSSSTGGSVEVGYKMLTGRGDYSAANARSVYESLCDRSTSYEQSERAKSLIRDVVSPEAMDAWTKCLQLSSKGLKYALTVYGGTTPGLGGVRSFVLELAFLTQPGLGNAVIEVTGLYVPDSVFACTGDLYARALEAKRTGKPIPLGNSFRGMTCIRQDLQTPRVSRGPGDLTVTLLSEEATVSVSTTAGSVSQYFPPIIKDPLPYTGSEFREVLAFKERMERIVIGDNIGTGSGVTIELGPKGTTNRISASGSRLGLQSGAVTLGGPINWSAMTGDGPACIYQRQCPPGWTDRGKAGFAVLESSTCPYDIGAQINPQGWFWCHPRLCCANQ